MSRHLENLNRLIQKLRERYGDGDEVVVQLKAEIEICQVHEAKRLENLMLHGERRSCRNASRCRSVASRIDKRLESFAAVQH